MPPRTRRCRRDPPGARAPEARGRRLLRPHERHPVVHRQRPLDQARERRGHRRLDARRARSRARARARSRAPRPPGPRARESRPPARPAPSSSPALRLRDVGASAVATRSPVPARPTNVRAWPPLDADSDSTSRKMSAAAMPAAFSPCAWVAPTATAAAFFATPASSTPTGSSDTSHTTPAALERLGHAVGERLRARGAHEPGPVLDHLARVRGAAHAGHPLRAEDGLEQRRGRGPVGRHEALGERDDSRAVRDAEPAGARRWPSPMPLEGTASRIEVGAAELVRLGAEGAHPQVARELHAGQVALVLTRARQLIGLLRRAAQERGADAGPLEQHRDGGAERPGPDDGGAAWMLARVADGAEKLALERRGLRTW